MTPAVKDAVRSFQLDPTGFTWVDRTNAHSCRHSDYSDRAAALGILGPFEYKELPLPFESSAIVTEGEVGRYIHMISRTQKSLVFTFSLNDGRRIFELETEFENATSGRKIWWDRDAEASIMLSAKPGESVVDVLTVMEQQAIRDYLYASAGFYGDVSAASPTKRKAQKGSGCCKPLYDWHTVVLAPPKPKQEPLGGTHASPRPHDRRGHFKNYKSGKRVWFAACKVNKGKIGFIFKDYKTKEKTT